MPLSLRFRHLTRLVAVAAIALALSLPGGRADAGPAGAWERISPPSQEGAATAYSPTHTSMYVFGGDGTNIMHTVSVFGPPTEWQNVPAVGTPPSARAGAAMTYDNLNDRLLVFGGKDYSGTFRDEVWELTLSGTPTWTLLATTGAGPAACWYANACYNEDRAQLFVFGGIGVSGALNANEVYKLDFTSPVPQWITATQSGSIPSARFAASLSFERNHDRLVLFGGSDGSSDLGDAYTFDLTTEAWTLVMPSGDTPPATSHHFADYDNESDLLFVWGGYSTDADVRTLDPATGVWTVRPNQSWQGTPTGHMHPVGAWIQDLGKFLVLDGNENTELWAFNYSTVNGTWWENNQQPGGLDDIRCAATFVYDHANRRAFLSGGNTYEFGPALQATWSYDLGATHGWYNTWFHNLSNNDTPPLYRHTAVWDDKRSRMLVFGGMTTGYVRQNGVYAMNESYGEYGGWYDWTTLSPTGTPPTARYGTAAIYDPVGDRMLVFGGSDVSGYPRRDLWQLSLDPTPVWSQLVVPGGPSGRQDHTAIYDAMHHRMIVFAGTDSVGSDSDNDVWALNLPALTWTHLLPSGTPAPGRYQHSAVYDSRRGRMLVFGGNVVFGADARDTWELDLMPATPVWHHLAPTTGSAGLPLDRYQHAAVYDSTGDRMLVYGGLLPPRGIFGSSYPLKDLWSLQFDGSGAVAGVESQTAAAEFAAGPPAPNPSHGLTRLSYTLPREAHVRAAIYDITGRRIVTLEDGVRAAGRHELTWDGRGTAGNAALSGIYFYRVESDSRAASQKVLLVR